MRTPFIASIIVSTALVSSFVFSGCTSLLGDFEVAPTTTSAEGGSCTMCNGECVDLTTSATNCGACGLVCQGGQVCEASTCKCTPDKAFCGAQCVVADRAHCGPTCSVCQSDEVCSEKCLAAPPPAFESTPLATTGWVDKDGKAIAFKLKPTGILNAILECRTGPAAAFTNDTPAWEKCDGKDGKEPTHSPKPVPGTEEGTYRTEYRYRSDDYRSQAVAFTFYAHHSLDRVPTCPRAGQADDGPHFTDDQYFAAALAFSAQPAGIDPFPVISAWPVPGNAKGDDFVLRNPFIRIPFVGARFLPAFQNGIVAWPTPTGSPPKIDWTVDERSLRHAYVLNPSRTLLLVRRTYVSPLRKDCKNNIEFGTERSERRFGPENRTKHYLDCEAFVLNRNGAALCMGRDGKGNPSVQLIERRPYDNNGVYGYADPTRTVSGTPGTTTVTSPTAFNIGWVNSHVQIPQTSGYWYRVTAWTAAAPNSITVSPALRDNVPAGTKISTTNNLREIFVVPTGYAKLHEVTHGRYANVPYPLTTGTKCETPGCADGKPYLTYLPP